MKTRVINKETILKSVTKMVSEKDIVLSYLKGKTPLNTLIEKGIKFAKPL